MSRALPDKKALAGLKEAKRKLDELYGEVTVVGNGMAGARAVEAVLLRGGGDQFDIVMFGDEPYGNYNRILLSSILGGTQDPSEIFINPLVQFEGTIAKSANSKTFPHSQFSSSLNPA